MPVDRELPTREAEDLIALTREIADAELAPKAAQYEREERFPREVFRLLGDAGDGRVGAHGGAGGDPDQPAAVAIEPAFDLLTSAERRW